jgi:hypothetical protein
MSILALLTLISGMSFIFFGIASFTTSHMKSEFKRYGLNNYRELVGVLQLLGALGLFFGYLFSPILQAIAASGLSVLMILGFFVRMRIRDSLIQSAPSISYAILNAFIFIMICDQSW